MTCMLLFEMSCVQQSKRKTLIWQALDWKGYFMIDHYKEDTEEVTMVFNHK